MRPRCNLFHLATAILQLIMPGLIPSFSPLPAIAQTVQDRKADCLRQKAMQEHQTVQLRGALTTFQQELTIRRAIGDWAGEGTTLNNIGAVYRHLGQYAQSLAYYQQALQIKREVGRSLPLQ